MHFGIIEQSNSSSNEELNEELDGAGHAVEVKTATAVPHSITLELEGRLTHLPRRWF